ncbi:MAG: hypothetical protein ACI8QS_003297 [Planctomycetota bacterium]|jgi:hypothetical protein
MESEQQKSAQDAGEPLEDRATMDNYWRDEDAYGLPRANFASSGLVIMLGVVLLGLLPATYFIWARPRMERSYSAQLQAAPTTNHGRLDKWFEVGAAMIHHRIAKIGRFSEAHPWIVTHAVRGADGQITAFGVDASLLTPELSWKDEMTIVVELPAPRVLGPIVLRGKRASSVKVYGEGEPVADPTLQLRDLTFWFLEDLPNALVSDIQGASLELRIGGVVVVPRIASEASATEGDEAAQPTGADGR